MSFDFMADGIDVANAGGGPEVKTTCPRCSHTRKKSTQKCLNVNLETGVYHCWHCSFGGKVPEFGSQQQHHHEPEPKAYVKPTLNVGGLSQGALKWFESRAITQEVLLRNRVHTAEVFMPQVGHKVLAVAFPYYRDNDAVDCKYRDHEKNFRRETGAERVLYGYDDIKPETVIVEGEMDKLACEVAGIEACVSVPDGAPPPNAKNISAKFDYLNDERLEKVERWIIAVDNDPPGERLQEELIRRFGAEKCKLVTWSDGCKDANDVLMFHGPRTLRECVEAAVPVPIVGVFDAQQFESEFIAMYDEGAPRGISTGWDNMEKLWRVQPGQLTVVTGIPGHGKSEWVDALCVNLAQDQGWRVGMYSPENQPVRLHLMKLAEKYIGKPFNAGPIDRMSKAEVKVATDWIQRHFRWIMPEKPSLDEVMEKARALVFRQGIRMLVIDPWNEVEHDRPNGMSEVEYIGTSLSRLRRFARKHELCVIVVAHPRLLEKKSDGYCVPTPYDISGGAMWRNKSDNCISVYADPSDPKGAVEIHVQKVKFKLFGQIGICRLRWDRPTGRYFDRLAA